MFYKIYNVLCLIKNLHQVSHSSKTELNLDRATRAVVLVRGARLCIDFTCRVMSGRVVVVSCGLSPHPVSLPVLAPTRLT